MTQTTMLKSLLRRDRAITLAGMAAIVGLAWLYILSGAGMRMPAMSSMMQGSMPMAWTPAHALLVVVMWAVMMVAMMLPSAAPMILLFATITRKEHAQAPPHLATALFAAGYVVVWGGFSVAAATLQWALERAALLSTAMATTSAVVGAAVLIAAGIYQFTPQKDACLQRCRSPLEFLSTHWRRGPFLMGLSHGLYCFGCCWALMLLLFVGGVMNLLWIVGLAMLVLIEKLAPRGVQIGYLAGAALIAWGGWTLLSAA